MTSRTRTLTVAAVVTLATVTGCSEYADERGRGDAPVGNQIEDKRDVIVMPDAFPNMVVACDGTTRLYVTTREAAPVAVPDHPACAGAAPINEEN